MLAAQLAFRTDQLRQSAFGGLCYVTWLKNGLFCVYENGLEDVNLANILMIAWDLKGAAIHLYECHMLGCQHRLGL